MSWNRTGLQGPPGPSSGAGLPYACSYCILYPVAAKFRQKDLSYASIWCSEFQGGDFTGINFTGANLTNANFTNAGNFPGGYSMSVTFTNTNLTNANFTNAVLRGTQDMGTANLTGVVWDNTICPDGTNSNDHDNTCAGHF